MSNRPIHRNLDTSFVNLSALVKYLRRRQFVGSVNIQLNGYQAEITLTDEAKMIVREHDQISGRVSEGEEALQRLLIRAREPGGTINVFQKTEPVRSVKQQLARTNTQAEKTSKEIVIPVEVVESPIPKPADIQVETQKPVRPAVAADAAGKRPVAKTRYKVQNGNRPPAKPQTVKKNDIGVKQPPLPDFPFNLTNKVERKAKTQLLSISDWQNLLKLSVELLGVVERSLAIHHLDFSAAFRKARTEIANDYPFMNPAANIFDYEHGRISMKEQVNETIYVSSIVESLKRILTKLGENPKFTVAHRDTSQLIVSLINKRKKHYDSFGLTVPLKRILGI